MRVKASNPQMQKEQTSEQKSQLADFLNRNEAVLKGIDEGLVIFDVDGKAAAANPAAARLLEQPIYDILGCTISAIINEDAKTNGHDQVIEFERGDKKFLVEIAPVRDICGQMVCTVAVFHDFAQDIDIERVRNDFVSLASHELRTPLSAVLGYIDMLREDVYGPLTSQQRSAIERAAANTEQLVSLINNLLDQAQIQAGGLTLHPMPFAPAKLVENIQVLMSRGARHKGLALVTHIDKDVPPAICGDYQRLCQILANLVDNAIKFTEDGTIRVKVYKPDKDHWALEVADTGRGIPEEAQSFIFAPFRQVDDPMKREYRGAGLGLSIVQQLVNRMEGEIKLESTVGQGSSFTVKLPLTPRDTEGLCSEMGKPSAPD